MGLWYRHAWPTLRNPWRAFWPPTYRLDPLTHRHRVTAPRWRPPRPRGGLWVDYALPRFGGQLRRLLLLINFALGPRPLALTHLWALGRFALAVAGASCLGVPLPHGHGLPPSPLLSEPTFAVPVRLGRALAAVWAAPWRRPRPDDPDEAPWLVQEEAPWLVRRAPRVDELRAFLPDPLPLDGPLLSTTPIKPVGAGLYDWRLEHFEGPTYAFRLENRFKFMICVRDQLCVNGAQPWAWAPEIADPLATAPTAADIGRRRAHRYETWGQRSQAGEPFVVGDRLRKVTRPSEGVVPDGASPFPWARFGWHNQALATSTFPPARLPNVPGGHALHETRPLPHLSRAKRAHAATGSYRFRWEL